MGNVLAELFQDQANAIREGLGDIGKFPPADFAERIRDIVALIGTGGGSGDSGGGESGGTGGSTGTGLKVTSGTFTTPDYDVDISINMSNFAASDRYSGLYVYEVSPAILPLAAGDAYYFQLGGQFWNPATGAKIFDALGQYAACYATGNVNLIEPDYSGNSSDTLLPYLCIYIEREDKNVIFTSMKINGMQVNFLKMDSLSGTKTIVHGLDVMPDFICVQHNYLAQALTKGAPLNSFLSAWAVKSDFANYFGEVLGAVAYSEGGTEIKYGLDDAANNVNARIRCRNDTTFMVGGTVKWYPKASYYWVAISGLGSSGGGDVVIEGVDPYYQQLAESMMLRDAKYLGDAEVLNLKTFVASDGGKIATLAPYSFAGFKATGMVFSDLVFIYENALRDCSKLKIIDITMTALLPSTGFLAGSLTGCSALESIIVRDGGGGVTSVGCMADNGANDTFCVYVPSSFYDEIVAGLGSNNIAASRYRKLEDYPLIDFWNETFTVEFYDGETLLNTVEVKCGESVSYTPEKEGALFVRWSPEPSEVAGNMKCYAQWLPTYDVRYWDGETLVETVTVFEGESASCSYTKDGYNFFGWSQEAVNVTEDMDIYGDWQLPFSAAPWETIDANAAAGKASTYYSVGDTKDIAITGHGTVPVRIVGFDHDNLSDGSGKAAITIGLAKTLNTTLQLKADNNPNGWSGSNLRSTISALLTKLPSDLQAVIRSVNKVSRGRASGTYNTTKDALWAFAAREMSNYQQYGDAKEGTVYEYYSADTSALRKLTNLSGTNVNYFLRSSAVWNGYWTAIDTSGIPQTFSNYKTYYIHFGFCIGAKE